MESSHELRLNRITGRSSGSNRAQNHDDTGPESQSNRTLDSGGDSPVRSTRTQRSAASARPQSGSNMARAGTDRGASVGSAMEYSDDFESRMRSSIRDELSVVLERILDDRERSSTFVPAAKGIEHKVAQAAGLCQTSFHRQMDSRLDKFQRQISELAVRVSSQETESKSFASNLLVGQHTSDIVGMKQEFFDVARKFTSSLDSRINQEQTERMALHSQLSDRMHKYESNSSFGGAVSVSHDVKREVLEDVKKSPEFRRVISDQIRASKEQARASERIAQIEGKFTNIAILEGHADIISGRVDTLARDWEDKFAELSIKYDNRYNHLREEFDDYVKCSKDDMEKLRDRCTTAESRIDQLVTTSNTLVKNFSVAKQNVKDLDKKVLELVELKDVVNNFKTAWDKYCEQNNNITSALRIDVGSIANIVEDSSADLQKQTARIRDSFKGLNRTVAEIHQKVKEQHEHGQVTENSIRNVRKELQSSIRRIKSELLQFKKGTQDVMQSVRNRLQEDLDDDVDETSSREAISKEPSAERTPPALIHLGERPSPSPSPEVEDMVKTLNKDLDRKRLRNFPTRKGSGPVSVPETVQEEPGERLPEELPDRALSAVSPTRANFSPPKLTKVQMAGPKAVPKRKPVEPGGYAEGLHFMSGGDMLSALDDAMAEFSPTASSINTNVMNMLSNQGASASTTNINQNAIGATIIQTGDRATLTSSPLKSPEPSPPVIRATGSASQNDHKEEIESNVNFILQQAKQQQSSQQEPIVLDTIPTARSLSDWDASSAAPTPMASNTLISRGGDSNTGKFNIQNVKSGSDWDASSAGNHSPRQNSTELAPKGQTLAFSDWDASSRGGPSNTGVMNPLSGTGLAPEHSSRHEARSISDWDASSLAASLPKTPMAVAAHVVQQSPSRQYTHSDWDESSRGIPTPRDPEPSSRRQSRGDAIKEEDELLFTKKEKPSNHGYI